MGNKFTITVDKLEIHPEVFTAENFKTVIQQELLNTQQRLRGAIAGGSGANGQEIKPGGYSASYREMIMRAKGSFESRARRDDSGKIKSIAKQTAKNQNKLAQKDPNVVNLFLTGQMLNSWQVTDVPNGGQMTFPNHQLPKVGGLLSRGFQGWLEYGQTDLMRIKAAVEKKVEALTKNLFKK